MSRALFLTVEAGEWTQDELDNLVESVKWAVGDDVKVMATVDEIEFLTEDQVEAYVNRLFELVREDD